VRRRLLLSTLLVAVVAVLLLGVPLAVVGTQLIEEQAGEQVRLDAERLAALVDDLLREGRPVSAERLSRTVRANRHAVVALPGAASRVRAGAALSSEPTIRATVNSEEGAEITLYRPRGPVDDQVRRAELFIAAAALLAVGAAVGLALLQARRLAEPLIELAEAAQRLGSGEARPRGRRYGVPELDRVAEVLDSSASRVQEMLALERQLAADASHQLRTPLTALSMRLEEIAVTDDPVVVKEEAAIALAQLERLVGVVDQLLANARESRSAAAVPTSIDAIVQQQVVEWQPAFAKSERTVTVDGIRGLWALATSGGLAQVLATLLENALVHGAGTVSLRTRRSGGSVVVEVSDEGPGVAADLAPHIFERSVSGAAGTGLGLAVVRDLAEADGGRLELVQLRPPVFAVFLSVPG
jgi:signal transduction histidine kinase